MKRKQNTWLFLPLPYEDARFKDAWDRYLEMRVHKRQAYKSEHSVKSQLDWFLKEHLTVEQAIESIETSIRNEWTGIFVQKGHAYGILSKATIGTSFNATDAAFAKLQGNIDQAMCQGDKDKGY